MTVYLGIDTGGTYTDAVLLRDEKEVIAAAKSLTTKTDLALGISKAVQKTVMQAQIDTRDISLACLSTTLATNALVEGQGDRVALVYIGFRSGDIEKHGLSAALKGDPYLELKGGHTHAGTEAAALEEDALRSWIEGLSGVYSFAVASQFATRNPSHEKRVAEMIREMTNAPVSASHQLSAKLNGPKRALTALLNARLIGLIDRLIERTDTQLHSLGINAPLMVVRGDGALISKDLAREKPIETILSGPAASIVGAQWLTGAKTALVSDIGGTTTDVALLRDGKPAIDPLGAQVGPYRTMVEAVAMRTTGLGGDSEVHFITEGLKGGVTLGPKRVLPLSLAAKENPEVVHEALDRQLKNTLPDDADGKFVRKLCDMDVAALGERDARLFRQLTYELQPLGDVVRSRLDGSALSRLVSLGVAQIAALTPSDASHVLGYTDAWDQEAARKGLLVFARRRTGSGDILSQEAHDMAQKIVDQLTHQTALALLTSAFCEEDYAFSNAPETLAQHELMQRGLSGFRGLVKIQTGLNVPVVGLGASAKSYYPAVGTHLNCDMILPEFAHVSNALGAVVGRTRIRKSGSVTSPSEGLYRLHLTDGIQDLQEEEAALRVLEAYLRKSASEEAKASGADDIHIDIDTEIKRANIEGRPIFVEAQMTAIASGRPRITG